MYLKKLEMKGFKSFADRIDIDFESGVTCVVGPNGSGKSNITDAVRWVLGEQKVKTLRGSKMEDVIFNGTKHRKPLGAAEVSLTFDNQDQNLNLDYSEVRITRRVYRSGESEYLINDTSCRLRDVRDLFMDTGIGTDGYSIIGQGRIDRILSNKPEERRQIFEEAAGIVKYKSRKREAERKLDNTNQNLLRVEDIINELAVRVDPLKEASEKASLYLDYSQELKGLEINQFIHESDSLQEELKSIVEKIENMRNEQKGLHDQRRELLQKVETLAEDIAKNESHIFQLDETYETTLQKLNTDENEKVVLEEKAIHSKANVERLHEELEQLKEQKLEMEDTLRSQSSNKGALEQEIQEVETVISQYESENQRLEKLFKEKETNHQESRDRIIEILNLVERRKVETKNLESLAQTMQNRLEQVDRDLIIERSKEESLELTIDGLNHDLEELKQYLENRLAKRGEDKVVLEQNEKQFEHQTNELNMDRKSLTEYEAEHKLLKEMEENYDGYGNSVRDALLACKKDKGLGKGIHGVVAELFQIPERYETAIDVILGRSLQNVVAETADDAKRVIKYLKENRIGRVTFAPLSNIRPNDVQKKELDEAKKIKGYLGVANELVLFESQYQKLFDYLLNRVIIVEDIDVATQMLKINRLKYRIVTLDGDLVIPGGTISGGSMKPKKTNILSRKRRIFELDNIIESLHVRIESLEQTIATLKVDIQAQQIAIEELTKIIDEHKLDEVRKKNDLTNAQKEMESLALLLKRLETEKTTLRKDVENTHGKIKAYGAEIEALNLENQQLEENMLTHKDEIDHVKVEIQEMHDKIVELKVERASVMEKYEHRLENMTRLKEELQAMGSRIANLDAQKETLTQDMSQFEARKEAVAKRIEESRKALEQLKGNQVSMRELLESSKHENVELEKTDIRLQSRISEISNMLEHMESQKSKMEWKHNNLLNNMWEKYEISYLEALEMRVEIDEKTMNRQIKALRKAIRDLGEVNLNAIKEYEEVSERYGFLTEQYQDLQDAQKQLTRVIRDLEKTMKQQFLEYFEEINEHFKEIFKALFTGGQADLVLLDKEDMLNSDVDIIAQPPGKKLQSLELMSGGERALTAIALLFAILKSKPTPFCILDEIEAALDDVNVYRFADFLKEFTQKSQFIIITHRKGTMEIADNLYGVTMEEYGVSKILSVRLENVAV